MPDEIDVSNTQFVSVRGGETILILAPKNEMTREEALRHAAYLVALAEREEGEFAKILGAVQNA